MVPRCSTTSRAECKRVMPSNRGLANHVVVSPISDSNEFMAGFPRSYTTVLLAISIPRFCVMEVRVPAGCMHVLARLRLRLHPVFALEADVGQIVAPPCLAQSGGPDLSPSDPAVGTPGRGE